MMARRILVVDNDREIVRLSCAYLERSGYEVLKAYDGETALHMLRRERPDLMLLDLMLPGRDGLDVTRVVRGDTGLAALPIIMLTARVENHDKIVGLEPIQCPTLFSNGYGGHDIQGIGDKHATWIHNVWNMDALMCIDDMESKKGLQLLTEPAGWRVLTQEYGIPESQVQQMATSFGISGVCNVLGAIKTAKFYGFGRDDVIVTVLTDAIDRYHSVMAQLTATYGQMDETEAPYGDIIALYPSHCFIPTVSALSLDTDDLFYDIAGDPDLLTITPFDAVYFPSENEEHMTITAESAGWFLYEARLGITGEEIPEQTPAAITLEQNYPNPFNPSTTVRFELSSAGPVRLCVYAANGSLIATLIDRAMPAGRYRHTWDGRADDGGPVASGVYFCRLDSGGGSLTRKIVLVR